MTKRFRYLSDSEPAPKAAKAEGKKGAAHAAEPADEGGSKRRKRVTSFSARAPEPEPAPAAEAAEAPADAPAPAEEPASKRRKRATSFATSAPEPEPAPAADAPAPAPAEEPAPKRRRRVSSMIGSAPEPEPAAAPAAPTPAPARVPEPAPPEPEPAAAPAAEAPAAVAPAVEAPVVEAPVVEASAAEADFTIETVPVSEVADEEPDFSSSTFRRRTRSGGRKKTTAPSAPEPAAAAEQPTPLAEEPAPAAEKPAPAAEKPAPAGATPAPAAPPPPPAPSQPTRREVNEGIVRSLFAARSDGDLAALRRLLSDDIAMILPGADGFVGRDAVFGAWARQAELLDASSAFEADLRSIAASDDHVFTYVETWAEAPGSAGVNYTTLTSYRIRGGQIVEIRQHVDDVDAYGDFWLALGRAAGPE